MTDAPTLPFESSSAFEAWLGAHQEDAGVWIKIAKRSTGIATISHEQALDVALCYGWIDGQRMGFDESFFLQKFTPRRPRSVWSQRNVSYVARLDTEGRMQPRGRAEVEAAQKDGRWAAAYEPASTMAVPRDLLSALDSRPQALAAFQRLAKSKTYEISLQLHKAVKPETRARRIERFVTQLEAGGQRWFS